MKIDLYYMLVGFEKELKIIRVFRNNIWYIDVNLYISGEVYLNLELSIIFIIDI